MNAAARKNAAGALFALTLFLLAAGCAAGLYLVVATIGLPLAPDPNEGWNAYHAVAAMSGAALYPGAASLMVNNYPPLSFYVVGTLGALFNDNILAGRWLSLLVFAAVAGLIVMIARAMRCGWRASAFGALFFAALLLLASDYVGMNDPQLLGHAIDLAGVLILVRARPATARILLAAFLFVLAGFVKHNLFVVPLAVAIWFRVEERRRSLEFILAGAAFAALGLVAFRLVYGTSLLVELSSPRSWSFHAAGTALFDWLTLGFAPLLCLAWLVTVDSHDRHLRLVAPWFIIGLFAGAFFSGGAGVDVNAMFDADIALALGSALVLQRLQDRAPVTAALTATAIAAPFAIVLWLAATPDWFTRDFWQSPSAEDAALARQDIEFLRAHEGPALCETLAFCYWAGKPASVDVFNVGEQYKTGARSDAPLVRLLEERHFSVVEFETFTPFALTQNIRAALARNYRIDHVDDDGVFLVPKAGPT